MTVHELGKVDMWTLDGDIYVVPTNARGIMGSGLAKDFAARFPAQSAAYVERCKRAEVGAGDAWPEPLGPNGSGNHAYVTFAVTKDEPREPSRQEWVTRALDRLFVLASMNMVAPRGMVILPAIGCGLGGLSFSWLHEKVLDRFDSIPGIEVGLIDPL